MEVPNHPKNTEMGKRQVPFSRELWIEREDYMETPSKGYFRLFPGNKVRLRYAYVVECIGYEKGSNTVRCKYLPETRSGTPGSDAVKVKGNIHWVSAMHDHEAEVRLYERLFKSAKPEGRDDLNPNSLVKLRARLERCLANENKWPVQFERHGYFISNRDGFNRTVTLRDSWHAAVK